jgi:hypothetical protein
MPLDDAVPAEKAGEDLRPAEIDSDDALVHRRRIP